MKILVIVLLGTNLNYLYYPMKDKDCFVSGMFVINKIARYYEHTEEKRQGYYTKDGRVVVVHYCK